jgi:bifunctional enzyme CysN/CysC
MSAAPTLRPRLSVVIGGHVDHGKSTVIGRLLADSGSLPDGKLDQVRALCARTGRTFEWAFLLDALKDERAQNITIDTARVFLRTPAREYLFLDAPGHVEFVRNLVTGASRADAAVLVIDAAEGIRENSRRHAYLMGMLGVRRLLLVVNKMDLVGYAEAAFRRVDGEARALLEEIGLPPVASIPIAAREGTNLVTRGTAMPWYAGPALLEALERLEPEAPPERIPFRMPVQEVYKFTGDGDDRRIVAGTIESGVVRPGDDLVFYPSGKRSRVRRLEAFGAPPPAEQGAGAAAGFTLEEQIYITRGEIACRLDEPRPAVATRIRVGLFWLGKSPLELGAQVMLKLGTGQATARVEAIHRALDAATLAVRASATAVERHEVAECTLALARPLAMDTVEVAPLTARFVLVHDYEIAGGGLVREVLPDPQMPGRDRVLLRNLKWETSFIAVDRRAERYRQRPTLLVLTGPREVDRKRLAKALEARLFAEGRTVYFLGMANVLYGVDADLSRAAADRAEHMRRLAEIAHLMLDAGVVLIVTAAELGAADLEIIRTSVAPDRILVAWLGDRGAEGYEPDLRLDESAVGVVGLERICALLDARGVFDLEEEGTDVP